MVHRLFSALLFMSIFLHPLLAQEEVIPITPGTYSGNITDAVSSVRYSFEAVTGQQVTIRMEAAGGSLLDAALSLFDPDGLPVQTDDDSAGERNAEIIFSPIKQW